MTIDLRPLLDDEPDPAAAFDLISKVDLHAFAEEAEPEHFAVERAVFECDRAILAWDGSDPVACAAAYSLELSIPGGTLPVGGVTWIGVSPTHRRRGIMTQLLDNLHQSMHEAGREPVAALWASQPPIYGRFGYGLATHCLSVVVQRAYGSLSRAPQDGSLSLRMLEPEADREFAQPIYDAIRARRPGMPALNEHWHASNTADVKADREGASPLRTVLVEGTDGVRGFARYAFKHDWSAGYANGVINVRTLMAVDPAAEAELWRHLIDFDLSGSVDVWNLPSDTPLQWWLDQPRHSKRQLHDSLYVRLVDVGDALTARTYAAPIDVVLDVSDKHCPWNAGRWTLAADAAGATCVPTTDAADLSLDVSMLGAAYLGGTSLDALGTAAWVTEQTPGALHHASLAFSHPTAPWSPFVF